MGSANTVILVGRLGADPDLRRTGEGKACCRLSVATNRAFTDGGGARQERTHWHKVVVWGRPAEICNEFLRKGRQIYVQGRLETRSFEDREKIRRTITEVVSDRVVFLDKGAGPPSPPADDETEGPDGSATAGGDDLPF